MDLLKRELAPILPAAWRAIDEEARRVLRLNLGGRRLVDLDGPHGWEHAAVNLGRLSIHEDAPSEGVDAGLRMVQPLAELRVPIELDLMELDGIARGAADPDLGPVVEAAEKVARVEDGAIFSGSDPLSVHGIVPASPHAPSSIPQEPGKIPQTVVEAGQVLQRAGIDGPYGLALGSHAFSLLARAAEDGYPIHKRVAQILEGPIVRAPALDGAVLLSVRGGDFVLSVGQDLSIGYASHDRDTVELYLTESFTFRVIEPAAAIHLEHAA